METYQRFYSTLYDGGAQECYNARCFLDIDQALILKATTAITLMPRGKALSTDLFPDDLYSKEDILASVLTNLDGLLN